MNCAHDGSGRSARRLLVLALVVAGCVLGFASAASAATQNPIQVENSLPGTPGWDDFASVAQQDAISGFASKTSVNHGDSIDFYVTTTSPSFKIDIFRTGWYQGIGARLVQSLGTFPGVHQAIPAPDPVTGMVSCDHWTKTTTLNVPSTWVTGVYLAKLTASNGNQTFITFTVRDDGGTEPILFQTSVTTYQAYNAWGGISLYTNNTNGSVYPYGHATKVSFDRPYDPLDGNGAGHFFSYEYPFIRWAESQGYNVSYMTDVDTATNVNPITNHRVYLSVGHDEYWSHAMRDNVTNAISQGVNAAFFSANTAYWQIRFEPDSLGVANRVEVGYKDYATFDGKPGPDPQWNFNSSIVTTNWRADPVDLPENSFIGVMYQDQVNRDYSYVVQNAGNWIYNGTGFANGTSVPGIVGYEYDKVWNNGFSPPGETVLSNSPVVGCCEGSGNSFSNSTLYTAASGAQVFAAGTIQWSWGLDNYSSDGQYVNAGIQKTTANILNAFSGGSSSAPVVSLSPSNVSLGNQVVGSSSTAQAVTLTNSGTTALSISGVAVTGANAGDFSQVNDCPSSLAAGTSCAISVSFLPTGTGPRVASVQVSDNAADSPQSVSVSGTGTAPAVTLAPSSLAFPSQPVGAHSGAQPVSLSNSGTAPLTISSIAVTGANAGDFGESGTCPMAPATLAVNASCTISVTFGPTAAGGRVAALQITDSAAGSPQTVALSGTGMTAAPAVALAPANATFGAQEVGSTSSAQSMTLTNTGNAALSISTIALSGANAADFGQTNTCPASPASLAAGAACSISVVFAPTRTGTRTASVQVTDSAGDSPQSVALSGTGTGPAVSLSPSSLAFGSQLTGSSSAAKLVTLTNSGTAPLSISALGVTGANGGDFAESDNCPVAPATVAAGGTCTISVTFNPTATGSRTGSVQITDNAPDSPQAIGLSGTGVAPAVGLSASTLDYGTQLIGTPSAVKVVTVTNTGTAALSIASILQAGTNPGDFPQTNTCPASLAVNASCTISVTFNPTATGSRTASVQITDNGPNSPQSIGLSGTGSTSSISLDQNLGTFTENKSGTTMKMTTTKAAAAGTRVFALVNWSSGSSTLSSVSGGGLTWTVDGQVKGVLSNYRVGIASAYAPLGLPVGTALTATFSASATHGDMAAASFKSIATATPVDVVAKSTQNAVVNWSASITTVNPNDLVLGASILDGQVTNTPTAPNLLIHSFNNSDFYSALTSEYQVATTAGTKTVNGTWSGNTTGSSTNATIVVAYKAG